MFFNTVYAATTTVLPIVTKIDTQIVNPILEVLFMSGLVVFGWGLVQFLWNSDNDAEKTKGKQHMLWGVVGMFILVSAFGILALLTNTISTLIGS